MGEVVQLVTKEERLRADDEAVSQVAHLEAVSMLEKMLEMMKTKKVSGLSISVVFDDGDYGHVIPKMTTDMSRLIGATAAMQHALIASTDD